LSDLATTTVPFAAMGASCSCDDSKRIVEEVSVEVEQKAADAAKAAKETAEAAENKVAEVADADQEKVAEAAKEVAEAVAEGAKVLQEKASEVAEIVEAKVAPIAEAVEDKATEVAEVAEAKVASVAEAAEEKAAEVAVVAEAKVAEVQSGVGAAAKDGTEVGCATMDAAVAAVTGVMIIEFVAEKGEVKKVHFKTKKVGFEMAMHGGGCCGPVGQAQARRLAAGTAPTLTPSLA